MPWRSPNYDGEFPSLGWGLLDFYEAYLVAPSGMFAGEPLVFTESQIRTIVRWYRIDPKTGRYVYRRGSKRAAKGKGKSPEAAAMAFGEFVGPVAFAGWDADGEPVGKPQAAPRVQVAACSEDQTGNTFGALYDMLRDSKAIDELRIDVGKTRFNFVGQPGALEPVTSSAGSREGDPITFSVLDETHLWTARNGGKRLAATIRRNLGKMGGRSWETTNAYVPGEGSVAEDTHRAWERGQAGLMYDAVEAPPVEDLHDRKTLRGALEVAYGDASWVDLDRIVEEIQDPSTDAADARRFYLNQIVKGERQAVDPAKWKPLERAGLPDAGSYIALGFDGSVSGDHTALIGCTKDRHLFELEVWSRPPNVTDWKVPRGEVRSYLRDVFSHYRVGMLFGDPPRWENDLEEWSVEFGEDVVVAFETYQTRKMARACGRFAATVDAGQLTWSGRALNEHVMAMARKKVRLVDEDDDGRTQFVFVKADTRKIDAGIAAVLALEAAMTMPEAPALKVPLVAWR